MLGLISKVEKNGRYGFIKYGHNQEIFFPIANVIGIIKNYLCPGLRVSFDVIKGNKGMPVARNIEMITD